jgi:hypothetical protein
MPFSCFEESPDFLEPAGGLSMGLIVEPPPEWPRASGAPEPLDSAEGGYLCYVLPGQSAEDPPGHHVIASVICDVSDDAIDVLLAGTHGVEPEVVPLPVALSRSWRFRSSGMVTDALIASGQVAGLATGSEGLLLTEPFTSRFAPGERSESRQNEFRPIARQRVVIALHVCVKSGCCVPAGFLSILDQSSREMSSMAKAPAPSAIRAARVFRTEEAVVMDFLTRARPKWRLVLQMTRAERM